VPGGWLVARTVPGRTASDLRTIATRILSLRRDRGVVVLGTDAGGKAALVAVTNTGTPARELLTDAARIVGGGAGGKGPVANAGGRLPEHLPRAIRTASERARALLAETTD